MKPQSLVFGVIFLAAKAQTVETTAVGLNVVSPGNTRQRLLSLWTQHSLVILLVQVPIVPVEASHFGNTIRYDDRFQIKDHQRPGTYWILKDRLVYPYSLKKNLFVTTTKRS